jgi:SAM-dependent methyltransferase
VKRGGLLAIERRPRPPLLLIFNRKIHRMLADVKRIELKPAPVKIELGDARHLPLEDASIDAVITSPPYLNKIEYTRVYKLELSFFFGESVTESKMRAFVGLEPKPSDISNLGLMLKDYESMPPIAQAYFYDLASALREIYRVCKPKANLAIVIGGGCFPDRVIYPDVVAAELATQIGFDVKKILVARETWCTRARTIKVGRMRESVLTLKKI